LQVPLLDLIKEVQKFECIDEEMLVFTMSSKDRLFTVHGKIEDL
jgi:hypothetical protein